MKPNLFYLLLLSIVFQTSCGSPTQESTSEQISQPLAFEIRPNEATHTTIDELFTDVDYIPLETKDKHIIGGISKLLFTEDKLIIFDRFYTKSIFIYTHEGKFIHQIHKKGNGPGEYSYPTDLNLNPSTQELELYDMESQKILFFDLDGKFIKETKVKCYFDQFARLDDNTYALYTAGENVINDKDYLSNLLITSQDCDSVLTDKFPHIDGADKFIWVNAFSRYNNTLYFNYGLDESIYEINKDTIKTAYTINFGQYQLPRELLQTAQDLDLVNEQIHKGEYAYQVHQFQETDTHIFFAYKYKDRKQLVVYDKENKNIQQLKSINKGYICPIATWKNKYVSVLEIEQLRELENLPTNLDKLQHTISEDSNPILMLAKFK